MATAHSQFGEESQETRAEMANETSTQTHHVEDVEIQEWLESLDSVLEASGPDVAREILERLRAHATGVETGAVSGVKTHGDDDNSPWPWERIRPSVSGLWGPAWGRL